MIARIFGRESRHLPTELHAAGRAVGHWILVLSFALGLSTGLVGCASKADIREIMLPLSVVRKIVMDNIPGGVRKQSMNGREISSEFFNALDLNEPSDTARERARATVYILGARRPYTIRVEVQREKRRAGSKKKYDKLGHDDKIAKQVVKRIKDALANRPADINIIDDFRAF